MLTNHIIKHNTHYNEFNDTYNKPGNRAAQSPKTLSRFALSAPVAPFA